MKSLSRLIPSGARIVLLILVAIVLPSVGLSIFAIWAIGAERAHMQDRVRREAHALTEKVVEATISVLSDVRNEIAGQVAKLNGNKVAEDAGGVLETLRLSYPYFSHLVIVDGEGTPVYPPVPRNETMIVLGESAGELNEALHKAQTLEFVQVDLEAAAAAYRETLRSSSSTAQLSTQKKGEQEKGELSSTKVSALLGLARVQAKQGQARQAIKNYRSVLNEYGAQREESGFLVGPAAALRIAQIFYNMDSPAEFAKEVISANREVTARRAKLTREEAGFLDAQLVSLLEGFISKETVPPAQVAEARRVLDEIRKRHMYEAISIGAAAALMQRQSPGFANRAATVGYKRNGKRFVMVIAPTNAGGRQLTACALAPVLDVERSLVATEVKRLGTREEVGVVVRDSERGVVAGEAPPERSYPLGESSFPEPLSNLRAQAYLKGYESLAALSDIRTKLYLWAVGLAISGIVAGAVVTYISVSRTMRMAELKSDFVSNVTHELKTPLTSIRMFAETLHDGRVSDKQDAKECLDTIVAESERLSRLIDRVLEFGAIEKGKRKFDFRMANLREVVLEALQTFRRQMRGCEATVYVNIPDDLPPARMDPDAVGEVLLNLLTNAYKYSRPEDRKIWVNARVDKSTVRVSVEDRGIGIPKRELKAIFNKFYRVDDLLTREVDGTGLGLTISRYVAEAHGGTIEVESKENKGSKFTLVLKRQVNRQKTKNTQQ